MDLSRAAPALVAPLLVVAVALLIFYVQIRIHLHTARFRGALWGGLIALCSGLFSFGSFLSSTASTVPAARLSTQIQFSSLVLVIVSLAGYTDTYLRIYNRRWHLVAGTLAIAMLAVIWFTDLLVTRTIQPVAYLLLPGSHVETTQAVLEPALMIAVMIGGLIPMGLWIAYRRRLAVSWVVIAAFALWLATGVHDALVVGLSVYVAPLPLIEYGMAGFSVAVLSQTLRDYFAALTLAERRRVELEQATRLAEAANRAKSSFLATMSHELRTPLSHVIGFTELVASRQLGDLTSLQVEYLNDSLASGKRLLALIDDLLDLSKVEAGKMALSLGPVSLETLLRESVHGVADGAALKQITIETRLDPLPPVTADERRLRQVFVNVLANAVKFTHPGGTVTIRAREEDSPGRAPSVQIRVTDTGIGLHAEDLESIFRPFHQVESSTARNFPGTGLGLSLSRQLVELHGGRIWAESAGLGAGATFAIRLPVASGTSVPGSG